MAFCPNCSATLTPDQALKCWNCNASFQSPSVWRPVNKKLGEFVPIAGTEAMSQVRVLEDPDATEESHFGFGVAAVLGVLVVLAMLVALTFPGKMAMWYVGASIVGLFEQDYGDPNAPLNQAVQSSSLKEFELLAHDRKQRKQAGFPRLTAKLAAEDGRSNALALLIDKHGFEVNQRIYDHSPNTAIDFAVANAQADTVEFLLSRGAKLHTSLEVGYSFGLWKLASVTESGQRRKDAVRIARLLIAQGEQMRADRKD